MALVPTGVDIQIDIILAKQSELRYQELQHLYSVLMHRICRITVSSVGVLHRAAVEDM